MDQQQFIEVVTRSWRAFDEAIAGLDDAALTEPGVVGDWSIKDLLGHTAAWEQQAIRHIEQWLRDERITRVAGLEVDRFNAAEGERRRGWPLAEAREEHAATRQRLLAAVASLPEVAWSSVVQLESGQQTLGEIIARDLGGDGPADHAAEHARHIAAWRAARGL
ncbi:MAG TPA: DinB family protein [Chloroflexaceae bacterium]|nr:DinB family protein [Chloroflexaceae bacterium]